MATVSTPTLAPDTVPSRGLPLPCPKCGELEATIDLNLADGSTLHCQDCDANIALEEIRELLAVWSRVVAWIDTMPGTPD